MKIRSHCVKFEWEKLQPIVVNFDFVTKQGDCSINKIII